MGVGEALERAGHEADNSNWLDHAVRFGLVAYGFVHLVIAWTAVQLALGNGGKKTSTEGALAQLADQSFGKVLIWAIAIGLLLLVAWRILEALVGSRDAYAYAADNDSGLDQVRQRLASVGKALVYGAVAVQAFRVATGSGGQSSKGSKTLTARIMDMPAGQWIIGLIGVGIVAYGAWKIWRGLTDDFLEHLDGKGRSGDAGRAYTWLGRAGYVSKGTAIGIVGGLFCFAAIDHKPGKTGGLDQALREVLDRPFGPVLLLVIAVGIGCYGLFSLVRARHLSR